MKKIILTIIFMMLIIPANVLAKGSVAVPIEELSVEMGGTATFNIVVEHAIAFANITSDDTNIVTVDVENPWDSDEGLKGTKKEFPITVRAVGAVGAKTKVKVVFYDASSYDEEYLATNDDPKTYEIDVTIVEKTAPAVNKYTVTFNANGGTNAPSDQKKIEKEDLTLSPTVPTRDGYSFEGWNTKPDGSGTSYQANGKYSEDKDVTLYAIWKETENVKKNPQTGDSMVYIVLLLTLGALIYSYWYMKKTQEN